MHPCLGCSGAPEDPCTTNVDISTAFGSSFDTPDPDGNGFHRLLCADATLVNDYIATGPLSNHITSSNVTYTTVVLVNTRDLPGLPAVGVWGGCGNMTDGIATFTGEYSNPTNMAKGVVHELGHTFGLLQDEYFYDNGTEAPNKDEAISPATPDIWSPWIGISGVDYYPHSDAFICGTTQSSENWYKPTTGGVCKMENVTSPFCPVCKEAIIERIHQLVNPIESFLPVDPITPTAPTPTVNAIEGQVFSLNLIEPTHQDMEVTWKINGNTVATVTSPPWQWTMDCGNQYLIAENPDIPGAENTLTAEVRDLTDGLVRSHLHPNPPFFNHNNHVWTQSWDIIWNGTDADLWMRDHSTDVGIQPWTPFGWFFDESPDIKVTQTPQGSTAFDDIQHVNPDIVANPNYVYVQVHNRGCETSSATTPLNVYTTINGSNDSWPANWDGTNSDGYVVGSATVAAIDGNASATVEIPWTVQDLVNGTPNWESCLLARIGVVGTNDPDDILEQFNIKDWIWKNNNISMHNVTVIDLFSPDVVELNGRPYPGGWAYVGNNGSTTEDFDIQLVLNDVKKDGLHNEAEIMLYLKETGFDISGAIADSSLVGLTRIDSTLFLVTGPDARIKNISIPADTLIPAFVGYAFLTQSVSDTMKYRYHLGQYISSAPDTLISAQHFWIDRVTRTLFSANAGNDVTILSDDTTTLSAASINENAIYLWSDANGDTIASGQTLDVSPSASTTYTLDVIANADGYKDYDNVSVTVTNGLITSVVPNPASTTTDVSYETTGVTTVKLKVVEVATALEVDSFTVTAGTGTKTITVSGYSTGAHIITLEGDGSDLDSRTLMVQ